MMDGANVTFRAGPWTPTPFILLGLVLDPRKLTQAVRGLFQRACDTHTVMIVSICQDMGVDRSLDSIG